MPKKPLQRRYGTRKQPKSKKQQARQKKINLEKVYEKFRSGRSLTEEECNMLAFDLNRRRICGEFLTSQELKFLRGYARSHKPPLSERVAELVYRGEIPWELVANLHQRASRGGSLVFELETILDKVSGELATNRSRMSEQERKRLEHIREILIKLIEEAEKEGYKSKKGKV